MRFFTYIRLAALAVLTSGVQGCSDVHDSSG